MNVSLTTLVDAMQAELRVAEIPDYSAAHNGLQLTNGSSQVGRVVAAVDASLPVIRSACEAGAQLLLVHHGLFWQGVQMLTGSVYEKLRLAMEHDLAIYSVHLPLDYHPVLGNNAELGRACGFQGAEIFGEGKLQGLAYKVNLSRTSLVATAERAVGGKVHLCPGGPEQVRQVGIITGGAGSEVAAVARCGVDTFITGEGPHWSYPLAQELGINVIYAGHYATETFGVKALAGWLEARFGLPWTFLDHPTGL